MPGAAGLQRVLEEEPGDAGTKALVCAMRARPAAACGRGAHVCFEPKLAGEGLACALRILAAIRPSDEQREQRRWA